MPNLEPGTFFGVFAIAGGAVVLLFSTFANIKYVDTRHHSILGLLKDIKNRIIRIEDHIINNKES